MRITPTILVIPTGIGCEIGGFAGDALPSAKLLASASGCLVTHPNVMNGGSLSCLLYTSPSPRDWTISRMPSSA